MQLVAAGWFMAFAGAALAVLGVAAWVDAPWFFAGVALFLALVVSTIAVVTARARDRRLTHIASIAETMATGDLGVRIDDDVDDRLGSLARSIDRIADGAVHDARRRRNAEQLLWHDSRHDPMTGFPNRRRLAELLDELSGTARVAVVFVEAEGLSSLNDRYGRRVGDEAILGIAGRLTAAAAGATVVGRWGGTEFIVVLTGSAVDDADRIVGSIDAAAESPIETSIGHCRAAITAGAVVARRPRDASALVPMAEQAMRRRRRGPSDAELARIRAAASN